MCSELLPGEGQAYRGNPASVLEAKKGGAMNKRGQSPTVAVPGFWTDNRRVRELLRRRGITLGPPTSEELVALFLSDHGLARAADHTAITGGRRPQHDGQDSVHQAWSHWKEWALAHSDWPEFWDRMMTRQADEEARACQYINSAEFRDDYNTLVLEEDRAESRHRRGRIVKLGIVALAAFAVVIGMAVETADRRAPESLQERVN